MKRNYFDTEDTIVALATPLGTSALGVIRISGPLAISIGAKVFSKPKTLSSAATHTIVYGHIVQRGGQHIDEVLVSVFRAPHGYTGEESLEISCHGAIPAIEAIITRLQEAGAVDALPGEFTFRAFMNGNIELTQAEAVHEVIHAKGSKGLSQALQRLEGSLGRRVDEMKQQVVQFMASISLQLDYPEEEMDVPIEAPFELIESVAQGAMQLVETFRAGQLFHQGVSLVLAGKTNAGKSSLFNLILSQERAIVSDIPGTTRDYIEDMVTIGGVPFRIYDTAGIRLSSDPIEQEGIRRTTQVLEDAHIILYVVSSVEGCTEDDAQWLEQYAGRVIPVWSQVDKAHAQPLPKPYDITREGKALEGLQFLPVSAVTGEGFSRLESRIIAMLPKETAPHYHGVIIESARQKGLLERVAQGCQAMVEQREPLEWLAMEGRSVLDALGELTGEVTTEDLFEQMFSQFCVGK